MCSYIYAPFLPNFSLGVLNPHVLVCGFLLYGSSQLRNHRAQRPHPSAMIPYFFPQVVLIVDED